MASRWWRPYHNRWTYCRAPHSALGACVRTKPTSWASFRQRTSPRHNPRLTPKIHIRNIAELRPKHSNGITLMKAVSQPMNLLSRTTQRPCRMRPNKADVMSIISPKDTPPRHNPRLTPLHPHLHLPPTHPRGLFCVWRWWWWCGGDEKDVGKLWFFEENVAVLDVVRKKK